VPAATARPQVLVLRQGQPQHFDIGNDVAPPFAWSLVDSSGRIAQGRSDTGWISIDVPLAPDCYRLRIEGQAERETVLIVAPPAAYRPRFSVEGRRVWVLAVQLYGVRSRRNWGHGDFGDLLRLIGIAADAGAAGVALNPLHALFADRADEASPYSPNSRFFLNPLYIDVDAIPEFAGLDAKQLRSVERLRATDLVAYADVAALKMRALRAAHGAFRRTAGEARRKEFDAYRAERQEMLPAFAAFETLRQRFAGPWWDWPPDCRQPDPRIIAELCRTAADEMEFHEFLQWTADSQLRACVGQARAKAMAIGLYLDMAVGVDPAGFDAWLEQHAIVRGLSVGAPPDLLNTAGQNWGLVSFSPRALLQSDFAAFRQTLRAVMRHAGAVRIDHVLGLNRLFLIPAGRDARHGAYVHFPLQAMLAAVAQESVAARCLVIGEDLGTVPDGFRDAMSDWGLWRYLLMMFERGHDGAFLPSSSYPRDALVAFNTHDLPTFIGWLVGNDLRLRWSLGIDPGETEEQRVAARQALRDAVADGGEAAFADVARWLARTPCGILAISVEDILGVADQVNLPGTTTEHPNWRRRWPVLLEDLPSDPGLKALADVLLREGRSAPHTSA